MLLGEFEVKVPVGVVEFLGGLKSPASQKQAHFLGLLAHKIVLNYPDGDWRLPKEVSRRFLCHHYTTNYSTTVIKPLINGGFIVKYGSYQVGRNAMSYSLSPALRNDVLKGDLIKVALKKATLITRILSWRKESQKRQYEKHPFLLAEAKMLLALKVDEDVLEEALQERIRMIQTSSKYKKKGLAIEQSYAAKGRVSRLGKAKSLDEVGIKYISGRVYHPLVNCPKEFRSAIVDEDGKPWVEIDLRSSQLVFLQRTLSLALENKLVVLNNGKLTCESNLLQKLDALLVKKHGFQTPEAMRGLPLDFVQFSVDVFEGDFYDINSVSAKKRPKPIPLVPYEGQDIFPGSIRIGKLPTRVRGELKKNFFRDILFSHHNKVSQSSSKFVQNFSSRYPTVYGFIVTCAQQSKALKKSRDLSLFLQKHESHFFHKNISLLLQQENIQHYIIHDAVYLDSQNYDIARKTIMVEEILYFGNTSMTGFVMA